MKLHHTGYAVKTIAAAAAVFEKLGFTADSAEISDESAHVMILFMRNGCTLIELVAPIGEDSPVSVWLKKNGPSPYHLCYATDSIDGAVSGLCAEGYVLVENCRAAAAMDGRRVAFLYNASVGLVELVEE